ncbi:MAG: aldo/keto reductase [Cellvibrio sp.]|uniref:aldo/keto reductase n=1 Tax=Cellvibrio sp. TaxID=1965322 RepID=UPI0031A01BC5
MSDAVPRRQLGRTGLAVSHIGLGCSGFWGNRRFPEVEAEKIVRRALERGVNFFDTGINYSGYHAEPRLGRILQRAFSQWPRENLIISSKAGTVTGQAGIHGEARDFSPAHIEQCCAQSLRNLHCDYLDIFQLHGIGEHQLTDELFTALEQMRRAGMFRFLGINTHSRSTMQHLAKHPGLFDVALIDYSALQQDREPVISAMHDAGIGVLAGTVLAQGHLSTNRMLQLKRTADIWYLARALFKPSSRKLMLGAAAMRNTIARIHSQAPAQTAFAYVLQNPAVASCILGTTQLDNLELILDTRIDALQKEERERIIETFGDGEASPSH